MHIQHPSRQTLMVAWLMLMVLTLGLMAAGKVGAPTHLGPVWSSLLLFFAGLKSGLILWFYLNLQHSTSGWKKAFGAFLVILLSFILATYLLTPEV